MITRRTLLRLGTTVGAAVGLPVSLRSSVGVKTVGHGSAFTDAVPDVGFPSQPPALVREIVTCRTSTWHECESWVQRIAGPHSIRLLAHARAGGAQAKDVVAYLEGLGGAEDRPALTALDDRTIALLSARTRLAPGRRTRSKSGSRRCLRRLLPGHPGPS